jgi:hypothetical protein
VSTDRARKLWQRALKALASAHRLPYEYRTLTPAEIARRTGDQRLNRLVYEYYYPAHYGRGAGNLSEEEAAQIVAAIEGTRHAVAEINREPLPQDKPQMCEVCGRRTVR